MRLSDLGSSNPKNEWLMLYERMILNQFLGLLVEMNAAAKSMKVRNKYIRYGEPEGPQRDFGFEREDSMLLHALVGVGTALIIGTDSLLKSINANSSGKVHGGGRPKINEIGWDVAIRAAANFIRHGDEWRDLYDKITGHTGGPGLDFDENAVMEKKFLAQIEAKNPRASGNIRDLISAGLELDDILYPSKIWNVARQLQLDDVEFSMSQMREFIDVSYDRSHLRKSKSSKKD